MKIKIQVTSPLLFFFIVLMMTFALALPFSLVFMLIFSGSPFWMWQVIFMPLALGYMVR